MSFEWWNNYEQTETQRNKVDLSEVSTSEVEKESGIVKQIKQIEIEDRENDLQELDFLEKQLEGWLDKDVQINEVKLSLYEKLWIEAETENNPDITKFVKWVVDWLVVNNLEEIQTLIESSIEEVLKMLEKLFDIEVLKELIKQTVSELWDIWNIMENPYNWGIALGTLWLWWLWKLLKWVKLWKSTIKEQKGSELYEMKGRDWKEFSKEWPNYVWKEIWDFVDSIDVKELLRDRNKLLDILKWIKEVGDYIEDNTLNILKLEPTKLNNFKDNISSLRKKIDSLLNEKSLNEKERFIINKFFEKLNNNYRDLLSKK